MNQHEPSKSQLNFRFQTTCRTLRLLTTLVFIALTQVIVSASAQSTITLESPSTPLTLLELYTSEGCSSCPRADRWLSGLKDDPRLWRELVPVAFHVNYWDYLGWKDRFARPQYSERQRRYARQGYAGGVYTPGFFVNGEEWRGWFSRPSLDTSTEQPTVGVLTVTVDADQFTATFKPESDIPALQLHIAVLGFNLQSDVRRGENAGTKLRHDFVALGYDHIPLTATDGQFQTRSSLPATNIHGGRQAIVAWVTAADKLRPLQSVGGWL